MTCICKRSKLVIDGYLTDDEKLHLGIPLAFFEGGHKSPQPQDWSGTSETSTQCGISEISTGTPPSSDRSHLSSANNPSMAIESHAESRANTGNEVCLPLEGAVKRQGSEASFSTRQEDHQHERQGSQRLSNVGIPENEQREAPCKQRMLISTIAKRLAQTRPANVF